jgi:hypothetical protein
MRLVDGTTDAFRCTACGQTASVAMVRVSASPDVDPEQIAKQRQYIERVRRTHEVAFLDALTFPIYGLDGGWTGSRSIEGWGGDPLERVTLLHGHPLDASAPAVHVTTLHASGDDELRKQVIMAAVRIARFAGGITAEVRAAIDHVRPQDHWDAATVIVDDEPLEARVFRVGVSWAAAIDLDGSDLVVTSRGLPVDDAALATVHDFAPYLAGA